MGAVKSYPSRELSRLRFEWLRSRQRLVVLMAAFYVAVVAGSSCWGVAYAGQHGWYVIGVLHASLAAMLLHLLNSAVLAHEPRAIFQLRGAWGEDMPDGHTVDGVHFVDGGKLEQWLRQLPPSPVSKEAAHDFLAKLADWRDRAAAVRA